MSTIRALQAISSDTRLTETEFEPDVRYVWVDEDGKPVRVQPFYDFAKAVVWHQGWGGRDLSLRTRIDREKSRRGGPTQHLLDRLEEELAQQSATGKAPVELLRVVLQATLQVISPAEAQILQDAADLQRRLEGS